MAFGFHEPPIALLMRTQLLIIPFGFFMAAGVMQAESPSLPIVEDVEIQPFSVYVRRLMEAVEYLGVPFEETEKKALEDALKDPDGKRAAKTIQKVLDARCLIGVRVTSGLRLTTKASPLAADAKLLEGGWRQFLIKVHNEARAKVALSVSSPDAAKLPGSPSEDIDRRWLDLKMFRGRPIQVTLSGVKLEYRIIQLYCRDRGKRSA